MPITFGRNRRHAANGGNPEPLTGIDSTDTDSQFASPPPEELGDEADLSSSAYARRRKELMMLLRELRVAGADIFLDIPAVVVIGGQSAGKSSLVEAVSGINVPRDSGTCTRCPMECTMSSDASSWSCKISLHQNYDAENRRLDSPTDNPFGTLLTDKRQVDIWLRRAQAAILNPFTPPGTFYTKSYEELRAFNSSGTLKFSRNVIHVDIKDPEATDLSFFDLPGLIQNEDEDTIDIVRSLTESYIQRKNAIILTTIPMSDDMENQQSMKLARIADRTGERTIGVLTKPDMLPQGSSGQLQRWRDLIEGKESQAKHHLKHGYYCVRLPDDEERRQNLSRAESQQRAEDYFRITPPWSEIQDRGRFGIPAFVSDVSKLLIKLIEDSLPGLREDLDKLLEKCSKDLESLPASRANDPQIEVLTRVNAFCDSFRGAVYGTSDKTLAQRNRGLYARFKKDIRGTAPDFRPFVDPERYKRIDDKEPLDDHVVNPGVRTMGLLDVRKVIKDSIAWELPNNVPYSAKQTLIQQFTKLWTDPTEQCFKSINVVLDDVTEIYIKEHFGRFKSLEDHVGIDQGRETLALEMVPYYTQNTHYFQTLREKWLGIYKIARSNPTMYDRRLTERPVSPTSSLAGSDRDAIDGYEDHYDVSSAYKGTDVPPEVMALRYLAQAGYRGLKLSYLSRLLPPDEFEAELIVMADVRAYFNVSYKRVIDYIPLKIEHSLHQTLAKQLSGSLLTSLMEQSNFARRMEELVSEDPATAERRSRLKTKKALLVDIRRKLMRF
ncbi:hypothetical protein BV22DRAFT_1107246 [Leucogyrophana mollusca]|uniref:Uncharacterized protein n=1 Tax=Leucogyrophana mollusca TaxID=85980 RepID=A0ACB8B810_9AGAM|nr:hypothetical protein BV22DRAFT_1107246 [Leucogyrophana mollusca]